jgi:hypothetical protein
MTAEIERLQAALQRAEADLAAANLQQPALEDSLAAAYARGGSLASADLPFVVAGLRRALGRAEETERSHERC